MEQIPWYEKKPFALSFPFSAWDSGSVNFPPHWHDFFEMMFVTRGRYYLSADDTVYEANSGDIIMLDSGITHSFFDTMPKTAVLGFQFSITFFDESFINMRDIVFQNPVIRKSKMTETLFANVNRLFREIFSEYSERKIGYQLGVKSKMYELMLLILRGMPKGEHVIPHTKSKRMYDFILKNFDNPDLALEEAAEALNLSKFYFARLFKNRMGCSFHSYLTTTRVNYAKRHLIETKLPIIDVAFRSGFGSLQTFNRVFKNLTGSTPGHYRRDNYNTSPL